MRVRAWCVSERKGEKETMEEDNYDDEQPAITTNDNNNTKVAQQQPTVPKVEMTKVVQPTIATTTGGGEDVLVHHHPSMHPGKILRFTELMHPQKSLEEEREIAREKRRQRKKEREEEEEEEEEDEESAHEEENDAREETDESEEEEEEGDYNKGGSDNEDLNGCHYRGEKLLPKVNQVMLDQDLNDDIDRKWKPGGRVDRDDVSLAARVAGMYASEKEAMREAMEDAADIDEVKKMEVAELEKEKFLIGVEQKDWEDDIMWDDDTGVVEAERRIAVGSEAHTTIQHEEKDGVTSPGIARKEKASSKDDDNESNDEDEDAENDSKNRKSVVSMQKLDSATIHAIKSSRVKRWGEYTEQPDDEDSKSTASLEYFEPPDTNSFQTLRLWTEIDRNNDKNNKKDESHKYSNPNVAVQDPNSLASGGSKEDIRVLGQAEARVQSGGSHRLAGLDKLVVRLVGQSDLPPEAALFTAEEDEKADAAVRKIKQTYQEHVSRELQERGALEMLKRKNQELLSGDWVDEVSWDGNPVYTDEISDPSKMFSELRINPNDPDLDLFADGDLDGSEFTRATAKVWKTRDLPPVADFEKTLNISIDEAYAPEVPEEGDVRERTRPGRLEGIIHSDFVYQNPPSLNRDPMDYPRPPPVLEVQPPQATKKKIGFMGIRIAGPSADETFKINVKSLTLDSAVATLKVKSSEAVGSIIQRVRKRWPELEGDLSLYFPKVGVEKQEPLDESMTLKDCGVKPQVGAPILYIESTKVHMISEEIATMRPIDDHALAPPGAFKKPSDLSIQDGHIMLVSYAEADPPLIAKPGMAAKKVTYYLRKSAGDQGARPLMGKSGQVFDLKPNAPSPFLSGLPPGVPVNVLETSMYRAPLFNRTPDMDDDSQPALYLLARGPTGKWSMRQVPHFFIAGQMEPHVEVPMPRSQECIDIEERMVNATVLKHFLELQKRSTPEDAHRPKLVKVSDIASSLNNVLTEDQIRSKLRLKICAPVRSSEGISKEDYALNPEYRFEHEKEIQKMCTPEDICAYESMRHAITELMQDRTPEQVKRMNKLLAVDFQSLTNAVTILVRHSKGKRARDLERIELMLQMQPWSVTREFLAYAAGKGVLHIDSSKKIQKETGKFWHYVRRLTKPPPPEELRPKVQPGTVTGTAADLRKLTMPQAARILKNFGIEDEVILKLERWKRIGLIRELSGAATADGNATHQNMSRFARSIKLSEVQQVEELKETSNFLFKRQWKRLARRDRKKKSDGNDDESSSGGDTDDGLNALCSDTEDSDDESDENQSDSDSDSLAAELEAELAMKARGPTEEEDAAELDQLRNELGGGIGTEDPKKLLERGIIPEGKKLRLKRITTHTFPDGRQATVEEDITDIAGEAWMQVRAQGKKASEEAATQALAAVGRAKPPDAPEEAPPEKKPAPKPLTFADKADAERAELVRRRKRAKERARRAKERIQRLQAQGLLIDGELDEDEMPDMKPVPGQGLKLSLNASRIKAAAQRTQSTPGGAQPRKKQGYKPRPGKPLWMLLTDLTEAIIKNKEFGQIFGTPVLLEDYRDFVEKPVDLNTILTKARENAYGTVMEWFADITMIETNAKSYHEAEQEVKMRIDWVPALATKLVGFVQTLLNRPYTKRDLKKADHTYSPQEEGGEDRGEDDQKSSGLTQTQPKMKMKFSFKMKPKVEESDGGGEATPAETNTATETGATGLETPTTGGGLNNDADDENEVEGGHQGDGNVNAAGNLD